MAQTFDHREAGQYWERNAEAWSVMAQAGHDKYRDLVNAPAFQELLGDVEGLRGLDIGCGEGYNTRLTARRGAHITAIDIAPTFLRHARNAEREYPLGIRHTRASAVHLPFADATFDFAMATMSFMDVPETEEVLREAYRVIRPGGFLQFSITHPCFMTRRWHWLTDEKGERTGVECGDYWNDDHGVDVWSFGSAPEEVRGQFTPFQVPRFPRTLSMWLNTLLDAGFLLERIAEPRPAEETAEQDPYVADARIVAYFLHVRARKPGA